MKPNLTPATLHPVLSNLTYRSGLPPLWGTVYKLTKLDDEMLRLIEQKADEQALEQIRPLALDATEQIGREFRVSV